jgi:hypothetical protein
MKTLLLILLLASFAPAQEKKETPKKDPPIAVYVYTNLPPHMSGPLRISDAPNPRWGGAEKTWERNALGLPNHSFVNLDGEKKVKPKLRKKARRGRR